MAFMLRLARSWSIHEGYPPHVLWYSVEFHTHVPCGGCVLHCFANLLFKLFTPWLVVEKDPRVPEMIVELLLHAADAVYRATNFRVAGEHKQDGVFARRHICHGVLEACVEWCV